MILGRRREIRRNSLVFKWCRLRVRISPRPPRACLSSRPEKHAITRSALSPVRPADLHFCAQRSSDQTRYAHDSQGGALGFAQAHRCPISSFKFLGRDWRQAAISELPRAESHRSSFQCYGAAVGAHVRLLNTLHVLRPKHSPRLSPR